MPDSHRAEPYINVCESDPEEARPRPVLVPAVQAANAVIKLMSNRVFRNAVEDASNKMPEGMAAEDISAQKDDIDGQYKAADSDAESVREDERLD